VYGGLLVLAVPIFEPHCWWSRPGEGTLEVGGEETTGTMPTWSLLVQRETWATDLVSPAFAVRAEQASEVWSTPACSATCVVARQMHLDYCLLRGRLKVSAGPSVA